MSEHRSTQQIAETLAHRAPGAPPWQRPALKATLVSKPALHNGALAYVEDVLRSG